MSSELAREAAGRAHDGGAALLSLRARVLEPAPDAGAGDGAVLGLRPGSPASRRALRRAGAEWRASGGAPGHLGRKPERGRHGEDASRAAPRGDVGASGAQGRDPDARLRASDRRSPSPSRARSLFPRSRKPGTSPCCSRAGARRPGCWWERIARALARRARDEFGLEVVLLDDGFQHRRLARDEDLVVVDEAVGFGNGRMLPRGPLREPLSALRRATLFWVRAASGDAPAPPLPPLPGPRVRTRYRPTAWWTPGSAAPAGGAVRSPVVALAGLARPGELPGTLSRSSARRSGTRPSSRITIASRPRSSSEVEPAPRSTERGW